MLFPEQVTVIRPGRGLHTQLRLRTGRTISVLISRAIRTWNETIRWRVDGVVRERPLVTLLVRLDTSNQSIQDFHLLPKIDRLGRFTIRLQDPWLDRGERLASLSNFCDAVKRVCVRCR